MRLYHYIESKWALENIEKRRLKISKIDETNDPYEFECVWSRHEPSQRGLDAFRKGFIDDYRVHCFGRSWSNILMWSHYAEKHKGICLGFDVPDDRAQEVFYVADVTVVERLVPAQGNENDDILKRLIWAKYDGWSYEQEVRVIGQKTNLLEEGGMYFVPFSEWLTLKEVIAGVRFSMGMGVIEEALKGYSGDVMISKARRSPTKFEIVLDDRGFDQQI